LFLTIGGILGGIYASRVGLKKSLWVMAACMTLPCITFVYLAICQPTNLALISTAIAIEQFGYGFGFTAYTVYLIYVARGENKTAHYAIGTGIMALGMMLPGMVAGWLQESMGYTLFFVWVTLCTLPGIIASLMVRREIPENFGKNE
jgi:PAT family beta-lactamase induction signal transducer AmpG